MLRNEGWESNKRWSDKFIPEIKEIIGRCFVSEAALEEDQQRCTDLISLELKPWRFACRIRRNHYWNKYSDEFTIRSRSGGCQTELHKIASGWGDYLFYGFASECDSTLIAWKIADLNVFRLQFTRKCIEGSAGQIPGRQMSNWDNRTAFAAFNWCDFPDEFVVHSSDTAYVN